MLRLLLALAVFGSTAARADETPLERGRYLVERVGMCADCHSPRNERGELIPSAFLGGAPIGFAPQHPIPGWADYAPQLAGIPGHYTEPELLHFLETGVRPDGSYAAPPMPPFRFSRVDAEAVALYLKSLPVPR